LPGKIKVAFGTLLQLERRGIFQDNEQFSRLKNVAVFDFFDVHWFPLKGSREVIRDFPRGNRKS
jgi:hypothetical protein